MPRVKIGSHALHVELEANEASIEALGKQALSLYSDACQIGTQHFPAPLIGFGRKLPDHTATSEP